MPRIESNFKFRCPFCRICIWCDRGFGAFREPTRIGLCIEFNAVCSCVFCPVDLLGVRIEKNRSSNAIRFKFLYDFRQKRFVMDSVPTRIRCNSIFSIGNQGHLCGLDSQNKVHKLGNGIALDIELSLYHFF